MDFRFFRCIPLLLVCIYFVGYSSCRQDYSDAKASSDLEKEKILDPLKKDRKNSEFLKSYEDLSIKIKSLDDLFPKKNNVPAPIPAPPLDHSLPSDWQLTNDPEETKRVLIRNVKSTQEERLKSICIVKGEMNDLDKTSESIRTKAGNFLKSSVLGIFSIYEVMEEIDRAIKLADSMGRVIELAKNAEKEAQDAVKNAAILIEEQTEIKKTIAEITNKIEKFEHEVLSDSETAAKDEKEFMLELQVIMTAMKVITRVQEAENAVGRIITLAKKAVNKSEAEADALETEFRGIKGLRVESIKQVAKLLQKGMVSSRSEYIFKRVVSDAKISGTSIKNKQTKISDLINKVHSKVTSGGGKSRVKNAEEDFNRALQDTEEALEELSIVELVR